MNPLISRFRIPPRIFALKTSYFCIRLNSTISTPLHNHESIRLNPEINILGNTYKIDSLTNVSSAILSKLSKALHRKPNHPLHTLKSRIEKHFETHHKKEFISLDSLNPIVTPKQNFDDLLFPANHPGRNVTDTYYINQSYLLRTHTSAHQNEILASQKSRGYLLSADVYRRDEINASHYPVFHQMEGLLLFNRKKLLEEAKEFIEKQNLESQKHGWAIEDETVITDGEGSNPVQVTHTREEAEIIGEHLKRTLEGLVRSIFVEEPDLKIRWIEGYFPFTSPSWEMEVFFRGNWLELCGCGVIQQQIVDQTGNTDSVGWAFGLGLERIAMVLFDIPDIRLFWTEDERFHSQFTSGKIVRFKPYSRYPVCYKDVSFWCPDTFHDNELCDIVREVAGDVVEDVTLIDEFVHKKTNRKSKCFRINYRSMDRTLTNEEVDKLQDEVRQVVTERCGVELR